jgi:hypothetical protein
MDQPLHLNDADTIPLHKSTRGDDIKYFFVHSQAKDSKDRKICKVCRQGFLYSALQFAELTISLGMPQ